MNSHRGSRRLSLACAFLCATLATAKPGLAQVRFSGEAGDAAVRVMSWRDIPFRTVVRQQHDYSCGSAALATLLTYHYGRPTTEADAFTAMFAVGDQAKIQKVGFSMLDMKHFLAAQGLHAEGFRITLDEVAQAGLPVIALINVGPYRHFVVIKGVRDGKVLVGDPALGLQTYPRAVFSQLWNGIALGIDERSGPASPRFDVASEWTPWSTAPVGAVQVRDTVTALTNNLSPLYQITAVGVLDSHGVGRGL